MRYGTECRTALVTLAALLAIGCKRTGAVEGDLSMVMQAGQVRRGAMQPVYLLRNGDSISQAVDRVCKDWKTREAQRAARAKEYDEKIERFRRAQDRASMQAGVALGDSVDKYRQAAAAERRQEDLFNSPLDRIVEMVRAAADTQVQTDLKAHYRVENLAPGRYVVFAEWASDQVYPFLAPVEVAAGEDKKLDLDGARLLRCQ